MADVAYFVRKYIATTHLHRVARLGGNLNGLLLVTSDRRKCIGWVNKIWAAFDATGGRLVLTTNM